MLHDAFHIFKAHFLCRRIFFVYASRSKGKETALPNILFIAADDLKSKFFEIIVIQ